MSANDNAKNVPNSLPVGYRFNEFEIKEVIGGGGFGIVYRAWDHLLERTIAIKEYLPISLATRYENQVIVLRSEHHQKLFAAGLNSFMQEARLLARFNHPGLLHVLRFWEENGTAYMGTLYYNGITLKEWQQSSPKTLTDAWIRHLLPPLFGAIDTIHRAGYLHRDISLDNIQIQENQLPVLLDFGSARKEIGNLSDEIEIMLKPGYAPIEQYSEESDIDQGPWTDIYALGAVLHTLVTGSPPPVSVVRCIEDRYDPLTKRRPKGFSLSLLNAIDRSLAMKAQDRPQSIDELAALIELPVSTVEEFVTTAPHVTKKVSPRASEPEQRQEPVVNAVNPGTAEPVAIQPVRKLSKSVVILAGVAVLVVVALASLLNHNDPQLKTNPPDVTKTPDAAQGMTVTEVPAALASPSAAANSIMATVYLKLGNSEKIMLNGKPVNVKPNNSGYAALNLVAGSYKIEVQSGTIVHSQQLEINRVGTWLINPG